MITVTIPEACRLLSVKKSKIYELIGNHEIEACKIGRRTLVTRRSLDDLVERGVVAAQQMWPQ